MAIPVAIYMCPFPAHRMSDAIDDLVPVNGIEMKISENGIREGSSSGGGHGLQTTLRPLGVGRLGKEIHLTLL